MSDEQWLPSASDQEDWEDVPPNPDAEIASLRKQLSESEAEIAEYKSESWCFNESHAKLAAEVATLHRENEGLTATVVTMQESAAALRQALEAARNQIEYLHAKFKETGSGNQVLAQIESLTPGAEREPQKP